MHYHKEINAEIDAEICSIFLFCLLKKKASCGSALNVEHWLADCSYSSTQTWAQHALLK